VGSVPSVGRHAADETAAKPPMDHGSQVVR
jgi:hypothetical protein